MAISAKQQEEEKLDLLTAAYLGDEASCFFLTKEKKARKAFSSYDMKYHLLIGLAPLALALSQKKFLISTVIFICSFLVCSFDHNHYLFLFYGDRLLLDPGWFLMFYLTLIHTLAGHCFYSHYKHALKRSLAIHMSHPDFQEALEIARIAGRPSVLGAVFGTIFSPIFFVTIGFCDFLNE